ncbi:hypothetical protein [Chitinophaga sp. RAB17]|uniref:hypothetical protein n=1 Tax=Chitinophaga sp. RAB17 TaxID=3233049 RepID=UPI003F8EEF0C
MSTLKEIFDGHFREQYPPFYGKTISLLVGKDGNNTNFFKYAPYHQYHLELLKVAPLYKSVSRIINTAYERS